YQYRTTVRFVQTFHGLKTAPSPQLQTLLSKINLTPEQIVFADLATPQAFCLGLIRPQIWLTTGLVELLSDDELTAVLAHEAHHCRHRDPLRLVISRALRAAFFFLPVVDSLAKAAELQQEIAADRSAIRTLGDDLPLLCALQKLIKQAGGTGRNGTAIIRAGIISDGAAVNSGVILMSFNVTEARLRYLLNPTTSINWRRQLKGIFLNGLMFTGLSVLIALSSQPVTAHNEVIACSPNTHLPPESYTTWVSNTASPYR
ncbi:MAG: M56 family metallopeptidase, partial [Anaerolineae bacterium]|nr:M56 family metallopeptidase [Anaerolineae bacterium]